MAYALITSTSKAAAVNTTVTTDAIDSSGGNFAVVNVGSYNAGTVVLTDSKSNTWNGLTNRVNVATGQTQRLFYTQGGTFGTNHTFKAEDLVLPIYPSIEVLIFSGAVASPFDQEAGADGSGINTLATGSLTPSENNCLVVTGLGHENNSSGAVAASSPFDTNDIMVAYGAGTNEGSGISYEIQTSATARNPSWSITNNAGMAVTLAVFKAAAAGGGGGPILGRGVLVNGVLRGRLFV